MSHALARLLSRAISAVPAVKYALGIAGVAAAVAIVAGLQLDPQIAIFGTVLMLGLMFVLLVFSALTRTAQRRLVPLALTTTWAFLALTIASAGLLMTSYFFEWPSDIASYLNRRNIVTDVNQRDVVTDDDALAAQGDAFLRAIYDGRISAAYELVGDRVRAEIFLPDFERMIHQTFSQFQMPPRDRRFERADTLPDGTRKITFRSVLDERLALQEEVFFTKGLVGSWEIVSVWIAPSSWPSPAAMQFLPQLTAAEVLAGVITSGTPNAGVPRSEVINRFVPFNAGWQTIVSSVGRMTSERSCDVIVSEVPSGTQVRLSSVADGCNLSISSRLVVSGRVERIQDDVIELADARFYRVDR